MVDVIEDIEENIEKTGEAIEELVEKGEKIAKKELKKAERKEGSRKTEEKEKSILKKTEEKIEEGVERVEEVIKEDIGKIKEFLKKDARKVKEFLEEKIRKDGEKEKQKRSLKEKAGSEKIQVSSSLKQRAEAESIRPGVAELEEKTIEQKRKELLEKAKKLREKLSGEEVSTEELKEKVKAKKRADMLVPLEEYVKAGIYLGTRVVTPNMRPFVYRRRADGLAIFNTDTIDEKLKEGIEFLSRFPPEDVILVCKRQAGWKMAEKFGEITGIRVFTKKYPAGILTNKQLPDFFENELTIVTDQWVDKNALNDTLRVKKKVLMICDTNNFSQGADSIIIGNNKSPKSIGLIFYLLARGYCKARGISVENIPDLEWWTGEIEERSEKKREKPIMAEAGAQFGV